MFKIDLGDISYFELIKKDVINCSVQIFLCMVAMDGFLVNGSGKYSSTCREMEGMRGSGKVQTDKK